MQEIGNEFIILGNLAGGKKEESVRNVIRRTSIDKLGRG